CRLLKGRTAGRTIPLFVVSDAAKGAFPEGLEIGAEECLTRPFSAPEALLKVKRSLERLEDHRILASACAELEKNLRKVQGDFDTATRVTNEGRSSAQGV